MARKPATPRAHRRLATLEKVDIGIACAVALDETEATGRWMSRFADLGDQPPLRLLCAATIAVGLVTKDRRLARTGLRMILAHSLATAAKNFLKEEIDRTRPDEALDEHEYKLKPGRTRDHDMTSMASGHSAGVVAVAGAAMVGYPAVSLSVGAAAASIVAAQLPSRNHFLSDVLAGGAIGIIGVVVAQAVLPVEAPTGKARR